jgi:Na+-driven multidrug efflux pump
VVGKSKLSSVLAFFRYGIIIIPAILILGPRLGVKGIYISNAISDGIASLVSILFIVFELIRLKQMEEGLKQR